MSGPFGSSQWMYSSGGFYPTEIEQSLRINDDDSAYLSRTPASAGNRKTATLSFWTKRGNLSNGVQHNHFQFGVYPNPRGVVFFNDNDTLAIGINYSGSTWYTGYSSAVFRDTSSWYHIVVKFDLTNGTAANRVKFYVNGIEQSFQSTPSWLNSDTALNNTVLHSLGANTTGAAEMDGYLAEVNLIDGQALDPTSFGEFKSGVWVAKSYSGSYGTNGFHLTFSNSGSLGADSSGNGNNWTPTNLAATDQVLDSPTNNFATWNPVAKNSSYAMATLSEGNLRSYNGAASNQYSEASFYLDTTNKYYFEYYNITTTDPFRPANLEIRDPINGNANRLNLYITNVGYVYVDASYTTGFPTLAAGDILQIAYDGSTGKIWAGKNGTWYNASGTAIGDPAAGTDPIGTLTPTDFKIQVIFYQQGCIMNFGQDSSFAGNKTAQGNTDDNGYGDFYYAPPSGYLALCTANLPDPAIDPAKDDVPEDYFSTVLYSGNSTNNHAITGVGFQPDFTWVKARTDVRTHSLVDAVRSAGKILSSNNTNAEYTDTTAFASFDPDGFTVGTTENYINNSSHNYVAWNWLAGNGTSSNTDGSITSTVSVNEKAGFSIISATSPASGNFTVGHGLTQAPEFVIVKDRNSGSYYWPVYHASTMTSVRNFLRLNTTDAQATSGGDMWGSAFPTSSVIGLSAGNVAATSNPFICYAFHSVEGYSKFGKYTGNGSTDGVFVYCGFRPSWIMWKRTDSTGGWTIIDTERSAYNQVGVNLSANSSSAETPYGQSDILSNGFKMRNTYSDSNASGGTYIFMAFSESPFKYSNAR